MKITVLKNSLWLAYNIVDPSKIQNMLPPNLKLANIRIYNSDRPQPKLLFNSYDVESQWMNGHRLEVVTIAKSLKHKTHHFVVLDCVSNALRWDPIDKIQLPNGICNLNVHNSNFKLNIRSPHLTSTKNLFHVSGLKEKPVKISKQFAVYPNYLCYFRQFDEAFKMRFDERIVSQQGRKLSLDKSKLSNNLWKSFREELPTHAFVYDEAMDFYIDEIKF